MGPDGNGEASNENIHSDGHFQRNCSGFLPPGPKRAAHAGGLTTIAPAGKSCRARVQGAQLAGKIGRACHPPIGSDSGERKCRARPQHGLGLRGRVSAGIGEDETRQ